MGKKDFYDMVVEERIAMILEQKEMVCENEWIAQAEKVMKDLNEEQKNSLLVYINQLIDEMAVAERKTYLGGIKDGLRMAGLVFPYLKLSEKADSEHIL